MNREELIQKWLDHNLNDQELEAFKQLEDFPQLAQLDHALKNYKSPEYSTVNELKSVMDKTVQKKSRKKRWLPLVASIAAIFVICIGIYQYTLSLDDTFSTLASQKQQVKLPDQSMVELNSSSTLGYNAHSWKNNREVYLDGEAYFKVAHGSTFTVHSGDGTVQVLGTKFNVKNREGFFEVICYEGLVKVSYGNNDIALAPGNHFLIRNGKLIATEKEKSKNPSWIDGYSTFKSAPYKEVIAEFERQYGVMMTLEAIDTSQLYTGSFVHDNIELALKSITLPLKLSYSRTNRTIILKRG